MKSSIILRFWRQSALLGAALCVLMFLNACGKPKSAEQKKSETPPVATNKTPEKPVTPPATTAKIPEKPVARPDVDDGLAAIFATPKDPATMSEQEKAWYDLRKSIQSLSDVPEQWQTNQTEPSKEEMQRYEKQLAEKVGTAADKAKDFYTRFPTNELALIARQQQLELLQAAVELGATNRQAQLDTLEEAMMKDPALTEENRIELRMTQLERKVSARHEESETAALGEFENGLRALQKEFTNRTEFSEILLGVAEEWVNRGETNKALTIAREVIAGNADEDVKDAAKDLLKDIEPKKP